jgi:hypothetical protein
MAEKTVISIEVEGTGKAINSIKELKAELKAAQSAALNGDGKAAKRVAELKDKMDDLKDTTKSLQGSGVEKISSGFSMLGQGFKDFDFDKIKTGFKGLGSAMSAIPIFLIIEGISYLVQNFDELSKGSGFLATILRSVSDAISWLVDGFTDLIGVTSESSRAIEDQGEAMVKANEKSQEALQGTTSEFDRQLAVAKAAGKSTIEIEQAKQQAIIDTNFQIAKGIEAQVRAGGEFTDEMKKQLSGSLEAIKNAKVQEYVITENDNKAKEEKYKKHLEEQNKIKAEAAKLEREQSIIDAEELFKQLSLHQDTELALRNKARKDELDAEKAAQEQKFQDDIFMEQFIKDQAAKEIEIEKTKQAHKQQIQMQALNTASQLVGLANQLAGSNKNVQKAALIAESAIGIAKIIISTRAANAAANLTPQAIATSGAAAIPVIAFNNISAALGIAASIAATTKALGALGGGSAGAAPSLGATPSAPSMPAGNGTPSIAAPQQNTTTFTGNNNNNFNQPPIKTYVVETDLRNSTNTIDKIKDQATF